MKKIFLILAIFTSTVIASDNGDQCPAGENCGGGDQCEEGSCGGNTPGQ